MNDEGTLDFSKMTEYNTPVSINLNRTLSVAFQKISEQYPNISKDLIRQYSNQWVIDRAQKGHSADSIANMSNGLLRGENDVDPEFIKSVLGMIGQDEYDAMSGETTGASLAPEAEVDPRGSIQDELRAFAGRMMQTVGADSPQAMRIAELAAQAGNKYAASSGMGPGGITSQGVAGTSARAHADLQIQREGIASSALAAAGNQQLSVDQLNTQLQQQNQAANVSQGAGIGGLIGNGVGLVGGIVASAYSGGAAAPAIPGLMAAGGAGGAALGGLVSNSGPPIQYGGSRPRTSSYNGGTS